MAGTREVPRPRYARLLSPPRAHPRYVATVRRVAGRLEGRVLAQPLAVLGPRVAAVTAHALMDLLPVLGALGRAIETRAGAGGIL